MLLRNTLINIFVAYTFNARRDVVELNASNATSFPKSVMLHSPPFMCYTLVISQVFRMARLVIANFVLKFSNFGCHGNKGVGLAQISLAQLNSPTPITPTRFVFPIKAELLPILC